MMQNHPLPRLDQASDVRAAFLKYCRLKPGQVWEDSSGKHRIGCLDASCISDVRLLMAGRLATLAVHDPPYNLVAFEKRSVSEFIHWCRMWTENTGDVLAEDASLYVWMGADQTDGFQPLPDFMVMMRNTVFRPRSFITMRN
ncbi:MAG: site-specific DNA-methyltransferase, partial [Acidobacteria bacterium]|nr:site-specific DNA-methyltransferase [Acidobacteriota bacterium]